MAFCSQCEKWVRERRRHYSDGTEISYYQSPDDKGHCEVLDIDTLPEFGCNQFTPATSSTCRIEAIDNAPWQRWTFIPCPDCSGVGSSNDRACRRCAGTAKVRRYDDGYVADATWDHPLEKERKKAQQAGVDPGLQGTVLRNVSSPKDGLGPPSDGINQNWET